jgi:hypothetical protein
VTLLGTVDDEGIPNFSVGSLSSLVGHNIQGYEPLVAWPKVQPDPTIRDAVRYSAEPEEDESKSFFDNKKASSSKGDNKKEHNKDGDSSGDDLLAVFSKKKKDRADSSSSSSSSSSGSDNESSSGSDSDSESDSDNSSSDSKSGSESDGSSSSSEDESDEVQPEARVPLAQQKITSSPRSTIKPAPVIAPVVVAPVVSKSAVSRAGMRKVTLKSKVGAVLSPELLTPTVSTSLLDDFDALNITTAIPKQSGSLPSISGVSQLASNPSCESDSVDDMFMGPSSNMGTMQPLMNSSSNFISALSMSLDDGLVNNASKAVVPSAFDGPSHNFTDSIATIPFTNSVNLVGSASSSESGKMSNNMILNAYNTSSTASQSVPVTSVLGVRQIPGQTTPGPPPANLVIEDLAEPKVLLRSEMGGGLSVTLVIRNNAVAVAYVGAISAYLFVKNNNTDRVIR